MIHYSWIGRWQCYLRCLRWVFYLAILERLQNCTWEGSRCCGGFWTQPGLPRWAVKSSGDRIADNLHNLENAECRLASKTFWLQPKLDGIAPKVSLKVKVCLDFLRNQTMVKVGVKNTKRLDIFVSIPCTLAVSGHFVLIVSRQRQL